VLKDLRRFQAEKENDLRRYMVSLSHPFFPSLCTSISSIHQQQYLTTAAQIEFAQCHIDWAKRNQAAWEEAKTEVNGIQPHTVLDE
jgi:hypothetical protein